MEDARKHRPGDASRWALYDPDAAAHPLPANLSIRPASAGDCAAIAAIEARRDGVDAGRAQDRCVAQLGDPDLLLLVALIGDGVQGFGRAGRFGSNQPDGSTSLPDGWYLLGMIVVDAWRRHGIGRELTRHRLAWIAQRADAAYYFANARNAASVDLHRALGFAEAARLASGAEMNFEGGEGVLWRIDFERVNTPGQY